MSYLTLYYLDSAGWLKDGVWLHLALKHVTLQERACQPSCHVSTVGLGHTAIDLPFPAGLIGDQKVDNREGFWSGVRFERRACVVERNTVARQTCQIPAQQSRAQLPLLRVFGII